MPGTIEPGTVVSHPVELTDLAPTIQDYLGAGTVAGQTGLDLRSTIETGARPARLMARGMCFDREANRAERAKDPTFAPKWRMVSLHGPEDHFVYREVETFPERYWVRGAEVRVGDPTSPPELDRVRGMMRDQARSILQGSAEELTAESVSDAERAALEALGYIEEDPAAPVPPAPEPQAPPVPEPPALPAPQPP
jgi:hypothetical protein